MPATPITTIGAWTREEREWVNVFAFNIWHRAMSYYKAVKMLKTKVYRTDEAIRKQLRIRVESLDRSE